MSSDDFRTRQQAAELAVARAPRGQRRHRLAALAGLVADQLRRERDAYRRATEHAQREADRLAERDPGQGDLFGPGTADVPAGQPVKVP